MRFARGSDSEIVKLALTLASNLQDVKNPSIVARTGTAASIIQNLHRSASQLVYALVHSSELSDIIELVGKLEGDLRTAAVVNVLSTSELDSYLSEVDGLHELLDNREQHR
jgi:hypothetical protein